MINLYLRHNEFATDVSEPALRKAKREDMLWVDVFTEDDGEKEAVEEVLDIKLLSKEEAQEIESSSKYFETESGIVANLNFIERNRDKLTVEPISFVVTDDGILVSIRHTDCDVFTETARRIQIEKDKNSSGFDIFVILTEAHIDREADMVELMAAQISQLSQEISESDRIGKYIIKKISQLQEQIITLRENIFDLQRVLISIRRSARFPQKLQHRLQLILKDIDSLINHSDFSFQRLDSLQDTALGLINIEQNEIVKILSVAAVVFMPPTLVASLYGMNFKYMPELDWEMTLQSGAIVPLGYIFAITLMLIFSVLTLWFFKYKKWL